LEEILFELASILILGMTAQWVGWRLGIPSILLLLIVGFIAGPITGFLDPDQLLGDLLIPIVSISVGIILFEGGLSLEVIELRQIGRVVRNLNSISVLVTWLLSAIAAHYILSLSWPLAILFGSILVVTGPTVIGPLLRHVGNIGVAGSILKWEGILIDPVGATLAVLVFEVILAGNLSGLPLESMGGFVKTLFIGLGIGLSGAWIIVEALKRDLIPDFLQNPMVLMFVVAAFALSNELQAESGLLATTIMGIGIANTHQIHADHIQEFKENLTVLLISSLFIILSARLDLSLVISELNINTLLFVVFLIIVARPLSVAVSTVGSDLRREEQLFISWLAPRGIVAAAVTSIFALELAHAGYEEAERLVPLIFLVIVGTVTVYGLTAVPVARWLGLGKEGVRGLLIVGAHDWAREMALVLEQQGRRVFLIDRNREHINSAKMAGLNALNGSILSELIEERVQLEGLGRLLALTANDEVNSLATLKYAEIFGGEEVYQLDPQRSKRGEKEPSVPKRLRGKTLFGKSVTASYIKERFNNGAIIKATPITDEFNYQKYQEHYGEQAIGLFILKDDKLEIITDQSHPQPKAGQTLISLVEPLENSPQNNDA
jgi:NhaP-type Na+/H+ or K+/H+ antiporter